MTKSAENVWLIVIAIKFRKKRNNLNYYSVWHILIIFWVKNALNCFDKIYQKDNHKVKGETNSKAPFQYLCIHAKAQTYIFKCTCTFEFHSFVDNWTLFKCSRKLSNHFAYNRYTLPLLLLLLLLLLPLLLANVESCGWKDQ